MRNKLVNQISHDILNDYETNWELVYERVKLYNVLLEENIRNLYEVHMVSLGCPLFALCYHIEEGWESFADTEEEFLEIILKLEEEVNEMFELELRDIGYKLGEIS